MTATDTTPKPLTLRPGAYYRTRDGRRVGPMKIYGDPSLRGSEFAATIEVGSFQGERLWHPSGRHIFGEDCLKLTAEWPELTPGPVVTRTATEIRPGTYGRVVVGKHLTPGWVDLRWATPGITKEELRAAIATLTELARGLDAIAVERNEDK